MVDRLSLSRRIDKLREARSILERLARVPADELKSDPIQRGAAERYLQLAAQCLVDIASHVLADQQLGVPDRYRDVFPRLAEAGLLEPSLARRLELWAGFRNVLVHLYLEAEFPEILSTLRDDLQDLDDALTWAAGLLE